MRLAPGSRSGSPSWVTEVSAGSYLVLAPGEAFFPDRNSYLGQAVLKEPPFEANVLLLRPRRPQ
jgi:hypothetical protein